VDRAHRRAVARPAGRARELEQRPAPVPPSVGQRRLGTPVRGRVRRPRLRVRRARRHHRPRPPAQRGRERGAEARAVGRSRGGLSTKLHVAVDALGDPLRVTPTPGQRHEAAQARTLGEGFAAGWAIADTACDGDAFRGGPAERGIGAVIPSDKSRSEPIPHDQHLRGERHAVERFFARLEQFRRIATRYGKTARNFLAAIHLACAMVRLR